MKLFRATPAPLGWGLRVGGGYHSHTDYALLLPSQVLVYVSLPTHDAVEDGSILNSLLHQSSLVVKASSCKGGERLT